ncbi:hypothetical protein P3S67_008416 [Capsicum chacoense]
MCFLRIWYGRTDTLKIIKPRYLVRAGIGLQVLEEQDWVFDLVRVSLYRSWLKRIPEDMAPNCPTLSTLILESLIALSLRECRQLRSVPPLGKLKNLRVLDVFETGIEEVPQVI